MSKRKLLKNTSTSSFGSPGREGHDSSAFYKTRLYADQPQAGTEAYMENPPAEVDVIFSHTSESMEELPDCSVHLMVTSPPYNVALVFVSAMRVSPSVMIEIGFVEPIARKREQKLEVIPGTSQYGKVSRVADATLLLPRKAG